MRVKPSSWNSAGASIGLYKLGEFIKKKWGIPGAVESILKFFLIIGLLVLSVQLLTVSVLMLAWSVKPLWEKIKKWKWVEKMWKENMYKLFLGNQVRYYKWIQNRKRTCVFGCLCMIMSVSMLRTAWTMWDRSPSEKPKRISVPRLKSKSVSVPKGDIAFEERVENLERKYKRFNGYSSK